MPKAKNHFDKCRTDPSGMFHLPRNVLDDNQLTKQQKLEILHQWAYDARQCLIAEEENMSDGTNNILQQILDAIHQIDPNYDASKNY